METQPPDESSVIEEVRPYRSHKFPACDRCRKRKVRCIVESEGAPCTLCRNRRTECVQSENTPNGKANEKRKNSPQIAENTPRRKRARQTITDLVQSGETVTTSAGNVDPVLDSNPSSVVQGRTVSHEDQSSVIVGPATAEDVQAVNQYLAMRTPPGQQSANRYNTISDNPKDPILYLQVPRHRQGVLPSKSHPGISQKDILEQILGPLAEEVIEMQVYLDHFNSILYFHG